MITLDDLRDMFADMRDRNNWDVNGDLCWGYFFTDSDPNQLQRAADW